MGLSCGGKTGRLILIVINLIFLLIGLTFLVLGIIMRVNNVALFTAELIGLTFLVLGIIMRVNNDALFTAEVRSTLNQVDLSGFSLGTLITVLNVIFICVGVFIVLVAGVGLIGTCCKARPLLIAYAVVIILILILQIVCVALWFFMRAKVVKTLEDKLYEALTVYDGVSSTDESSNGWDIIFIDYECCGTVAITSTNGNGNHFGQTKWKKGGASDLVPPSCCKGATKKNYKTYTNTACTVNLTDNWQQSCYEKLRDELIEKYMLGAIILGVTLLVIEIVALIFAFVLCTSIGKD